MPATPYLERRQNDIIPYYDYPKYYDNDPNEKWNSWGRYVAAAAVIIFFIFLFLLFAVLRVKRRQRRGFAPYNGTGWIARKFPNNGRLRGGDANQQTYPQQTYYPPPQPPRNPDADGIYDTPAPPYTPNPAFEQQTGVTSPAPPAPYYAPPPGPPPAAQGQQAYEMTTSPPMNQQYTGTSIQSNNPYYQPPNSPPPAHLGGAPPKY
ncbi:hypothetical protein EX30DRAFT_131616 [Ascodesmis nigricans]|uniref:Uncharacterized protein n=1 Tax=Ascodesmis nigricans TaxID=341454 RepID=A0A4S2MNM2_9PEZI|nr:hypothetical protein EX30DRAFT_131616 [Ascodesmis nigricans]